MLSNEVEYLKDGIEYDKEYVEAFLRYHLYPVRFFPKEILEIVFRILIDEDENTLLFEVIESWKDKLSKVNRNSPRWKKCNDLLIEINEVMNTRDTTS